MNRVFQQQPRCKAVWGPKRIVLAALVVMFAFAPSAFAAKAKKAKAGVPNHFAHRYKMDEELESRSKGVFNRLGRTRVIVVLEPGAQLPKEFQQFSLNRRLDLINGEVLELPNGLLKKLSDVGGVESLHYDRPTRSHNYRTAVTVGARTVQDNLGFTGAGVGIAVIDSGITSWHDDLTNGNNSKIYPYGNQRLWKFVDFVNGRTLPYDDNGHGSHVAGIIAGNGYDSKGEKAGIAPGASLVSLKVLDSHGTGTISNIIAALGWVVTNAKTYNIRVVNLSVGAPVRESYWTDPLTIATKVVTDNGIVVVAAAGNMGTNDAGQLQWGGITAPGNAPWVLTVGASSTNGTLTRSDDTMAPFSSSGPTAFDFLAKPDLVAPGTGTVSLAVPGSEFYITKSLYLIDGRLNLGVKPYLALSGTSMAAPVVSGSVALMLQANPKLTPNLVKAILQYTAEVYPGYSPLREGAGFLNTLGAVRLAQYYATGYGTQMPVQSIWSRQIIWGNHRLTGGYIVPTTNAWATNVVWGTAKTLGAGGDNIVWGTMADGDNIVWGTAAGGDNIVWGTSADGDNVVWGTSGDGDNVVWGTSRDGDNIVWGTDCGGADCDNVVWGTARDGDNIVWGTAAEGDNIVWGTAGLQNIVWSTSADENSSWSTSDSGEAPLFNDDATEPLPSLLLEFGDILPLPSIGSTIGGL